MSKRLVFSHNPLLSGPALGDRQSTGIPYRELLLSEIERDPNQPRVEFNEEKLQELADSIKLYGVLSPITVKKSEKGNKPYILVFGERRFRAAQNAGLKSIPAIVDSSESEDDARTLAIQLVENIQRDELTALEKAHAISTLKEAYDLSIREVATRLGISKSMVQRSLDLLELPDDLLNALRQGASESKILMLAKVSDKDLRSQYLKKLDELTREDLQASLLPKIQETKKRTNSVTSKQDPEDMRIEEELQRSLGLKVKLKRSKKSSESGKLTVELHCEQDLQLVFRRLVGESS